jgi:hypothetical protein
MAKVLITVERTFLSFFIVLSVGFIFIMVVDAEQRAGKGEHFAKGDEDGRIDHSGRRKDKGGKDKYQSAQTHDHS